MVDPAEAAREKLIEVIAAYLARWPTAADTARGIADWWLSAMGLNVSDDEVQEALDELVNRGGVEITRLPGGIPVYRAPVRRH